MALVRVASTAVTTDSGDSGQGRGSEANGSQGIEPARHGDQPGPSDHPQPGDQPQPTPASQDDHARPGDQPDRSDTQPASTSRGWPARGGERTAMSGSGGPDEIWRRPEGMAGSNDQPPRGFPGRAGAAPVANGTAAAQRPVGQPSPWARPDGGPAGGSGAEQRSGQGRGAPSAGPPPYAGPPRTEPPPRGWRPPLVAPPATPRTLPPQDRERIDAEERAAHTLTLGVGMIAGAILLIATCLLCSRALF